MDEIDKAIDDVIIMVSKLPNVPKPRYRLLVMDDGTFLPIKIERPFQTVWFFDHPEYGFYGIKSNGERT